MLTLHVFTYTFVLGKLSSTFCNSVFWPPLNLSIFIGLVEKSTITSAAVHCSKSHFYNIYSASIWSAPDGCRGREGKRNTLNILLEHHQVYQQRNCQYTLVDALWDSLVKLFWSVFNKKNIFSSSISGTKGHIFRTLLVVLKVFFVYPLCIFINFSGNSWS